MAAVAEFPEIVKSAFITKEFNKHGVYTIRFFIRGKPWLVSVDDEIAYDMKNDRPYFVNVVDNKITWVSIMEKAYAKMKGTYSTFDDNSSAVALRALTGAPTYTYKFGYTKLDSDEMWDILNSGDEKKYMMNAASYSGDDTEGCGLPMGSAYSLISTFKLDDNKMMMFRHPKGKSMD